MKNHYRIYTDFSVRCNCSDCAAKRGKQATQAEIDAALQRSQASREAVELRR